MTQTDAVHSQLAVSSRPAGDELPYCPLYDFLFSNPFRIDSPIITRSPSASTQDHHIPIVPLQKPIFINTDGIGDSVTWCELRRIARAIGAYLNHELRLQPPLLPKGSAGPSGLSTGLLSPVVLLHLPNGIPFVEMLLGSLAAGLTVTLVSPSLTHHELEHVLLGTNPAIIVTTSNGLNSILEGLSLLKDPQLRKYLATHIYIADDATSSHPQDRALPGAHTTWVKAPNREDCKLTDWKVFMQSTSHSSQQDTFRFKDNRLEAKSRIAVILWSSGTGGRIKGVMWSHYALVATICSYWHQKLEYGADERAMGLVPFCHVMGLLTVVLTSITAGTTVCIAKKFEPRRFLEVITNCKITSLAIAPPIAIFLAKSPLLNEGQYDLSSVRNSMSGGAPLAPEIIKTLFNRCGFLVKSGYGLSEAGHVANQVGSTLDELLPQLGTVGEVMYGVEAKIISPSTKQLVKKQEEGEILIRSSSLMSGYLNNPTETQRALDQEGWLHTGDLGRLDCRNRLTITGRLKDIIKVKGFQVSPSDLESLISKVEAVGEVAVTGFYCEEEATEYPRAYIVPQDANLAEICELVARCGISSFDPTQHPRYSDLATLALQIKRLVEAETAYYKWLRGNIVVTSQIPKSPSGKVLKRILAGTHGVMIPLYQAKSFYPSISKL